MVFMQSRKYAVESNKTTFLTSGVGHVHLMHCNGGGLIGGGCRSDDEWMTEDTQFNELGKVAFV